MFDRGRLIQLGTPEDIYARPQTLFVADFIGRANFLPVRLSIAGSPISGVTFRNGATLRPERAVRLEGAEAATLPTADDGMLMIRPEHLALDTAEGTIACRVLRIQLLGGIIRYTAQTDASPGNIFVEVTRMLPGMAEGAGAFLRIPPTDAVLYHR